MDCTNFPVHGFSCFDRELLSHKFHSAALRYEIYLSIFTGNIVRVNGPFKPGVYSDVSIYRNDLKKLIIYSELVLTDDGYPDNTRVCSRNCMVENKKIHSRIIARHEIVNERLKNFKILSTRFRLNHNFRTFFPLRHACNRFDFG